MEPTPSFSTGSTPAALLTVHIEVVEERKGGCRLTFSVPDGSALLTRYGTRGRALAACRDILVGDIDVLVREFAADE
jgi:hypothetical protein